MERYDDPVEVRKGQVQGWSEEGPEQFLWHGRLWKVRSVLAHWVETGPWRQSTGVRAVADSDAALAERELWRVEAGRGTGDGVFDLSFNGSDGRWQLVACGD